MTDTSEIRHDLTLAQYVRGELHAIINALHHHERDMEEAATVAKQAWQAGQDDPAVKAAQDASIMTNNGLHHSAQLFTQDATKARQVAQRLSLLVEGDDGDPE